MTLEPILWNVVDARALGLLAARVQVAVFGHAEGCLADWDECAREAERERPLTRWDFFTGMCYAYEHLNRAWNGRNLPRGEVEAAERTDVSALRRFPREEAFRDLWPERPMTAKERRAPVPDCDDPRPFAWNSLMAALLQEATRKLDILHYRLHLALGGRAAAAKFRPAGLRPEWDEKPFSEEELGRRLSKICWNANMAWGFRNGSANPLTGKPWTDRATRGWLHFPRVFVEWIEELGET